MAVNLKEGMYKAWYWYISKADKNAEVLFMNYGYNDKETPLLQIEDNANRFSIQMYYQLASEAEISNKDILEIGSGRGGGLAFVTDHFKPRMATGLELNQQAVSFCNKHYKHNGLSFVQGDAQNLSLENESYDVVLNVESSHRYPQFRSFLSEVYRILRPGGYLLLTDFRYDWEMPQFEKDVLESDLTLIKKTDITERVVEALDMDDQRKRELISRLAPKILRNKALSFAGAINSPTYNSFVSREFLYFNYIFQKK